MIYRNRLTAKAVYRLGLLAICLLAFALRLYLLEDIFLNEDEEKSELLYVRQPAAQILLHYEPNNHWLTSGLGHLSGLLGLQRFFLRWPSVFFGTLAVPLIALAGCWLFKSRTIATLSAGWLSLSAFHIYWSQQFRGYSVLLFFSMLSLLLLYRALQTGRRVYGWGFGASIALALASHLYGVLVLFIGLVMLLGWLRTQAGLGRMQRSRAGLGGIVALGLIGYWLWLGKQYVINVYHPPPEATLSQLIYYQGLAFWPTLPEISDFLKGIALAYTAHPSEGWAVALFGGLALSGWYFCAPRFPRAIRFLALWLLLPIAIVSAADFALAGFFVLNRFLIFTLPAWLLLAVGGLTLGADHLAGYLAQTGWRRSLPGFVLLAVSVGYMGWLNLQAVQAYFEDKADHDWRGVAAYLAGQIQSGDLIICDRLLLRSPPHPDESEECVLELRRRLAALTVPNKMPKIADAAALQAPPLESGSTPGTVWVVVWDITAPPAWPAAITFDRLGYTSLLKIDSGPTLTANLVQAVDQLTHLEPPLADSAQRLLVNFGSPRSIRLIGYAMPAALQAGQTIPVTTYWQAVKPVATDYTIFLHLRNPAGQTVAQLDFRPFEGVYPTSRWRPGSIIAETRQWQLPLYLPPGPYTLHAGLYQLKTLARLPAIEHNDGENAVTLGEIWLE